MPRGERCTACRPSGFTLVEVAASLAILASVIVGLLVAQARTQRMCALARDIMFCTRLCSSQVAALRADLVGEGEGEFFDPAGYTWRITRMEPPTDAAHQLEAFEVRVVPSSRREEGSVSVTVWLPALGESETKRP